MKFQTLKHADLVTVSLVGKVDEGIERELMDLAMRLEGNAVSFDCAGIVSINSIGIKSWCQFLSVLEQRGVKFNFQNCVPEYVDYCNLLPTKLFTGRIVSVAFPCRCRDCGARTQPFLEVSALLSDDSPALGNCNACGGKQLSVFPPVEYLSFSQP